uniref:Restriction endonuclease subunit S n=1 Tax=Oscillatoriales cyanobacterium SpSt-402 TaxID=2282168 RepID=A0A832H4K4_9CYAN
MGGYLEYPEYKDSGVEWLDKIPAHWSHVRVKYVGNIRYGLGEPPPKLDDGLPIIRATDIYRGTIDGSRVQRVDPDKVPWSRKPELKANDILVVRSGAYTGDSAIVPEEWAGSVAGYDMVLTATTADPKYLAINLLSKHVLEGQIYLAKTRAAQPHLNAEELGSVVIAFPPLDEQQTIARFLDYKTAQIDALIAKKETLLAKLAEKHTALISQAVTKGLDPTVPLKPSGIEWLGDIPAHWDVAKLLYVSESIQTGPFGSQLHADEYIEGGTPIVNPADIYEGELLLNPRTTVTDEVVERLSRHKLQLGDIVLGRRGEIGRAGLVKEENVDWLCGSGSMRIRLRREKLEPTYLLSQFSIPKVAGYLTLQSVGSTMDNLSGSIVGRLHVLLPPLEEQNQISEAVQQIREEMLISSSRIQDAIAKLKEYRTALITNAVTGKIDVRDVKLP